MTEEEIHAWYDTQKEELFLNHITAVQSGKSPIKEKKKYLAAMAKVRKTYEKKLMAIYKKESKGKKVKNPFAPDPLWKRLWHKLKKPPKKEDEE